MNTNTRGWAEIGKFNLIQTQHNPRDNVFSRLEIRKSDDTIRRVFILDISKIN
jgi:hypothetical protein